MRQIPRNSSARHRPADGWWWPNDLSKQPKTPRGVVCLTFPFSPSLTDSVCGWIKTAANGMRIYSHRRRRCHHMEAACATRCARHIVPLRLARTRCLGWVFPLSYFLFCVSLVLYFRWPDASWAAACARVIGSGIRAAHLAAGCVRCCRCVDYAKR